MFYSYSILAKKGPLAKIWQAAHWSKRVTKAQVFGVDIEQGCADIQNPTVPLALRVSGHLLLGVVNVYSLKVNYLYSDCQDAIGKLKRGAYSSAGGGVDLEETHKVARSREINVGGGFGDFDDDEDRLFGNEFDDDLNDMALGDDNANWLALTTQPASRPSTAPSVGSRAQDSSSVAGSYTSSHGRRHHRLSFRSRKGSMMDEEEEEEDLVGGDDEELPTPAPAGLSRLSGATPDLEVRGAETPGERRRRDSSLGATLAQAGGGAGAGGEEEEEDLMGVVDDRPLMDGDDGAGWYGDAGASAGGTPGFDNLQSPDMGALAVTPANAHDLSLVDSPAMGAPTLLTRAELEAATDMPGSAGGETRRAKRTRKRRAAPTLTVDNRTQLGSKQYTLWDKAPESRMQPRLSTAKRLRQLREDREEARQDALGRRSRAVLHRSDYLPSASETLMEVLDKGFAAGMPSYEDAFSDDDDDEEGMGEGEEGKAMDAEAASQFGHDGGRLAQMSDVLQQQGDDDDVPVDDRPLMHDDGGAPEENQEEPYGDGPDGFDAHADMMSPAGASRLSMGDAAGEPSMLDGADFDTYGDGEDDGQGGNGDDAQDGTDVRGRMDWRKLGSRAKRVMDTLGNCFETETSVTYDTLAKGATRRTVAGCFFDLLVLKSFDVADVRQEEAYGDITITKSAIFDKELAALRQLTA